MYNVHHGTGQLNRNSYRFIYILCELCVGLRMPAVLGLGYITLEWSMGLPSNPVIRSHLAVNLTSVLRTTVSMFDLLDTTQPFSTVRLLLWPTYVIGQAIIFLSCGFFFFIFFYLFSSPNLSGRRLDVLYCLP